MLDSALLDELLTGETSRVEWKEREVDSGKILPPVCAFANDLENSGKAGYLVLGVEDRSDLGYVQRLGRGVRLVKKYLVREGHPPLEVETDGFTTVTVRRRP